MKIEHRFLHPVRVVLLVLFNATLISAFLVSHIPGKELPDLYGTGKYIHFAGFVGLATLLLLMLAGFGEGRIVRSATTVLVFAAYAATDEWTQPWFGRSCEFSDWLIDTVGAVAAVIAWELIFAYLAERRRKAVLRRYE